MRLALGDLEFVKYTLAAVRGAGDRMLEGDVQELEEWARTISILRGSIAASGIQRGSNKSED